MSEEPPDASTQLDDLQRENSELLQFLYACPVGLVALDATGFMTMLNPFAMQLVLPLARDNQVTNLFKILEPYAPDLRSLVAGCKAKRGTICDQHRVFVGREGLRGPEKVLSLTLVKLDAGAMMATLSDISEQVSQERRLKQAEAWFSSVLDGGEDFAALSLSADGLIDHVDPSVCRRTGFSPQDLIGGSLGLLDAPDAASGTISSAEQIQLAARDGWYLNEGWCAQRDGTRLWCQRLITVYREEGDADGDSVSGFTVVLREVERHSADAGTLKRRLTTDHLTGAANRAHFFDVAAHQAVKCGRDGGATALVVLDIDHFKQVNDVFGHALGDEVLKAVTEACRSALGPGDTLARLGGEEFVVMMPATDLWQSCEAAERMRLAIAAVEVAAPEHGIRVTASFGCAVLGGPNLDVAQVLAQADAALYAAKRDGRDRVALAPLQEVAA